MRIRDAAIFLSEQKLYAEIVVNDIPGTVVINPTVWNDGSMQIHLTNGDPYVSTVFADFIGEGRIDHIRRFLSDLSKHYRRVESQKELDCGNN